MLEAVTVGSLLIPVRPMSVILSLVAFVWLAGRLAARLGHDPGRMRRVAEGSAWTGLIGARIGFAGMNWTAYEDAPWTLLYVWQPGYLWWTGIAAGITYALWSAGRRVDVDGLRPLGVLGGAFTGGVCVLGVLLVMARLLADPDRLREGDEMPDFELSTIEGEPVRFSSLSGRVVVLNFWATWCPPCRREMPLLSSVHMQYSGSGVTVVGVNVDEPPEVVRAYIQSVAAGYPNWLGASAAEPLPGDSEGIYRQIRGVGLPTTVFVDPSGIITDIHVGELSRGLLQSRIEAALSRP